MHIASLEDDEVQGRFIQAVLEDVGHTCTLFTTGKAFLAALTRHHDFDLLLLDWEVPDISGLDIVRWVRGNLGQAIPVMFLTNRIQETDLVMGLQAGADDYVVKPLRKGELIARISALHRRMATPVASQEEPFNCGSYLVDPSAQTISLQGVPVELAPKEYELALLFFRNPGRLFSRDVLSNNVWNREIPATSRTLDTHLSNIRRKLLLRPENGVRLTASYALGYRLELIADNQDSHTL